MRLARTACHKGSCTRYACSVRGTTHCTACKALCKTEGRCCARSEFRTCACRADTARCMGALLRSRGRMIDAAGSRNCMVRDSSRFRLFPSPCMCCKSLGSDGHTREFLRTLRRKTPLAAQERRTDARRCVAAGSLARAYQRAMDTSAGTSPRIGGGTGVRRVMKRGTASCISPS